MVKGRLRIFVLKVKFQSFKVYFNNIPEGHRPMWIYTMYARMSTGKYNDKLFNCLTVNIRQIVYNILHFTAHIVIQILRI